MKAVEKSARNKTFFICGSFEDNLELNLNVMFEA